MILSTEQLKKLQQIELQIFKLFISICEKEQLGYFLIGGTLIGAVRHKGFIPWDDDIDIGMPRKDYEKFISIASKYLSNRYFLQTMESDKDYPYPFAKIRDKNTIYKEDFLSNLPNNHGIWIDIFPLDYCKPNNWIHYAYYRLLNKRILSRFQTIYHLRDYFWKYALKIIFPSFKHAINSRHKIMTRYQTDTGYIANLTGRYGHREMVPSAWFKKPVWLEFEGIQVSVPTEYHKYLTNIYGDYMKLPPMEKRISLHQVAEIDFDIIAGDKK